MQYDYVEYGPYNILLSLKKELLNKQGIVSHKFIRDYIKEGIRSYDDNYIAKVGQLLTLIETHEPCEDIKFSEISEEGSCKLVEKIKKSINMLSFSFLALRFTYVVCGVFFTGVNI
jgi:hypothetical protein